MNDRYPIKSALALVILALLVGLAVLLSDGYPYGLLFWPLPGFLAWVAFVWRRQSLPVIVGGAILVQASLIGFLPAGNWAADRLVVIGVLSLLSLGHVGLFMALTGRRSLESLELISIRQGGWFLISALVASVVIAVAQASVELVLYAPKMAGVIRENFLVWVTYHFLGDLTGYLVSFPAFHALWRMQRAPRNRYRPLWALLPALLIFPATMSFTGLNPAVIALPLVVVAIVLGGMFGASVSLMCSALTYSVLSLYDGVWTGFNAIEVVGGSAIDRIVLLLCMGIPALAVAAAVEQNQRYRQGLEQLVQHKTRDLAEALQAMEELASADALTGLYNRRKLLEIADHEGDRASRSGIPIAVILVDLDHFKVCNDTLGHQIGDQVLEQTARTLKESMRRSDAVARWGGEEFLVLAPGACLRDGMGLANKLRERLSMVQVDGVPPITCSAGVAVWITGESFDACLMRSDQAMYLAKEQGRNQVCSEADPALPAFALPGSSVLQVHLEEDPELELEHRALLAAIDQLADAGKERNGRDQILGLLHRFEFQLAEHYRHEDLRERHDAHPDLGSRSELRYASLERLRRVISRYGRDELILREVLGSLMFELRQDMIFLRYGT